MSLIRGKNVVLYITGWFDRTGPFPLFSNRVIACARSVTLTTTTSLIETTTAGSGKGATYQPQKNNTTGSLEGLMFVNEVNKITIPYLRSIQLGHAKAQGIIVRTADDGSTYKDTFGFWITSIADTGATGDFDTFQMDFQVDGDPIIEVLDATETVVTERTAQWEFLDNEPGALINNVPFTHTIIHSLNSNIAISIAGQQPNKWFALRVPNDEADFTSWYNTAFNFGPIPDSVFYMETIGIWKYIKSRTAVTFDTTQTLKFTH